MGVLQFSSICAVRKGDSAGTNQGWVGSCAGERETAGSAGNRGRPCCGNPETTPRRRQQIGKSPAACTSAAPRFAGSWTNLFPRNRVRRPPESSQSCARSHHPGSSVPPVSHDAASWPCAEVIQDSDRGYGAESLTEHRIEHLGRIAEECAGSGGVLI